jgi:hypothetical protein
MFQPRMVNVCAVSGSHVRPVTLLRLRGSGSATQRSLSEATKQREAKPLGAESAEFTEGTRGSLTARREPRRQIYGFGLTVKGLLAAG